MNPIDSSIAQAHEARDQLASDLQMLTTHAHELSQACRSLPGDAVGVAREKLDETLRMARERLALIGQEAGNRSREAVARLDAQVRDNPKESIASVALASLAMGWLSRGSASGALNNMARVAALGVAGAAGLVLMSFWNRPKSVMAEVEPEEVGRWESEGGNPSGVGSAS